MAQNAGYVSEMPSVANVRQQIRGSDPLDTLAQQAIVYEVPKDMARVQIGNPGALDNLSALSRAERELLQSDLAAQQAIFATPGIDVPALNERVLRYAATPEFPATAAAVLASVTALAAYWFFGNDEPVRTEAPWPSCRSKT